MLYFLFMYSVGQLKAAAASGTPRRASRVWCLLLSIFIAWLYMVLGGYVGTQWSMAFQAHSRLCRGAPRHMGDHLGRRFL
jgi:Na+/proline symporter